MPTGLFTVEAANTLDHNLDYNRLISWHRDFTHSHILKVQIITYQTTVSLRKVVTFLPEKYITVLPAALKTKALTVLPVNNSVQLINFNVDGKSKQTCENKSQ